MVSLSPVHRCRGPRDGHDQCCGAFLSVLRSGTVEWCETVLKRSPMAIRMIKRALNAELDGQAGLMEFAGDATLLYYLMPEAQEGKNAFLEKRDPDFEQVPEVPGISEADNAHCRLQKNKTAVQGDLRSLPAHACAPSSATWSGYTTATIPAWSG